MKVYEGIILIAPLLNLDAIWRGVVNVTPRPLYPRQNTCPFSRWPCGSHCRSGVCGRKESRVPPRIRAPDRPTALSRLLVFCVTDEFNRDKMKETHNSSYRKMYLHSSNRHSILRYGTVVNSRKECDTWGLDALAFDSGL